MPKMLRPILLALMLAATSAAMLGCGGNGGPSPSLSAQEAAVLTSKIDEIKANVDVGSCVVASDKTEELIADVQDLPSSVNSDVKQALENGANQLKLLLADPSQCEGRTTTSTPSSTTESTTTTKTRPSTTTAPTQTQPTTTTQTQTTQTTTPGASGGIGPGGL